MPTIRPFRALRYSTEVVRDLGAVVAPPYDIVSPDDRRRLLARDPRNVVRLDFPQFEPGDADDDERYRRAAHLLRSWRSDGRLRQDPRPSFYPYEQTFDLPGGGMASPRAASAAAVASAASPAGAEPADAAGQLVRRGLFARLALEPYEPATGVRPHERTMSGPREDRYRLLRATDVNTSPVVGLYEDRTRDIASWLDEVAANGAPLAELVDDDGVRHRLWAVTADRAPGWLAARIGDGPVTIADGHHRYETALRYRDERRRGSPAAAEGSAIEPAPWDDILALLLEPIAGPVAVLATHRVVRGLGSSGVAAVRARLGELFDVQPDVPAAELMRAFAPHAGPPAGDGRFGLWTRDGGAILHARRLAFAPLLASGGTALRRLDVSLLGAALERLVGIDGAAVDAGARIAYTKDASEAIRTVDEGRDDADAAFLLDPTPAADIVAVAAEGDVMPQKSTYIYPKALTGLVMNPWSDRMTDTTPDAILARAQSPAVNGRPIRKDEIEIQDRGIYIESWLPERRSRRKPLLFVHGELGGSWVWERYLGYFAGRGWEGHALNLRNHYWSQTAEPEELSFESYVEDVGAAMDRLGPGIVVVGHGMGGLLALKAAERHPVAGIVLIASELPRDLRRPSQPHEIRDVPDVYGRSMLGWETLPEWLQRDHRDLTLDDIRRIQHLLGQKAHESGRARRTMLRGVVIQPGRFEGVPRLVIAGGLDQAVDLEASEQFATWLGAEFEPFAAHSAYGLILGEHSHGQVADAVRGFLELHRL